MTNEPALHEACTKYWCEEAHEPNSRCPQFQLEIITVHTVKILMKKAVDAYGREWVDPNAGTHPDDTGTVCLNTYTYEGRKCHCLIGWILTEHGYDLDDITGGVSRTVMKLAGTGYWADKVITEEALSYLEAAQKLQDKGTPWGQVYDEVVGT
jgi:hypothetical protein